MAAVRELIGLACEGCKRRNYTTTKNKKRQTDKFAIKKFCLVVPLAHAASRVQGNLSWFMERAAGERVSSSNWPEHRTPNPRVAGSNPA